MSSHSSEELKSLSNELDKVSEKIAILQDTITYGQAVMDALERSRAGPPIERKRLPRSTKHLRQLSKSLKMLVKKLLKILKSP